MTSKFLKGFLPVGLASLVLANSASAVTVLTFEGVGDLNAIPANYYNGGAGGNFGIVFSPNTLALVDGDAGWSGNFGGEPSPDTIMFFLSGGASTMDVLGGFTTGFSFFYSAVGAPGSITVWDGPGATGNILATLPLPTTPSNGGDPTGQFSPFFPIGVTFSGTAMSVDFGGTVNAIGFDNITIGSGTPVASVPEAGASLGLLSLALTGMFLARKKLK